MAESELAAKPGRMRWALAAFVVLAGGLVCMKCLCPTDPAKAFPGQTTNVAEIRGAPLRSATPETPAASPAPAPTPSVAVAEMPRAETAPPTPPAPEPLLATAPPPVVVAAAPKVEERVATAKPVAAKPADPTKLAKITWEDISKFKYVPPEPDSDDPLAAAKAKPKEDQIPADIRAMAGKRVEIDGYVVPLEFEKGVATKFILINAPLACCFAEAPPMNKWMTVTNAGKSEFDYAKYAVVRVTGVFDVGEETREGYVVGIYRLKAEKIENVEQ